MRFSSCRLAGRLGCRLGCRPGRPGRAETLEHVIAVTGLALAHRQPVLIGGGGQPATLEDRAVADLHAPMAPLGEQVIEGVMVQFTARPGEHHRLHLAARREGAAIGTGPGPVETRRQAFDQAGKIGLLFPVAHQADPLDHRRADTVIDDAQTQIAHVRRGLDETVDLQHRHDRAMLLRPHHPPLIPGDKQRRDADKHRAHGGQRLVVMGEPAPHHRFLPSACTGQDGVSTGRLLRRSRVAVQQRP